MIVVFDLSDANSLTSIARWMEDATASASNPQRFVVGAKKDLVVSPTVFSIYTCKSLKMGLVD